MEKQKKQPKKRMTKQECEDWDELYEYVRTKVFEYDEKQALPSSTVLRLKGMLNGKFIANNNIEDRADYSYRVVLNTFKYCMPEIRKALNNVRVKDERHKTNLVCKIVENNLNDVYMRMKNAKKTREEIEKKPIVVRKSAVYKPKVKNVDRYSDMW